MQPQTHSDLAYVMNSCTIITVPSKKPWEANLGTVVEITPPLLLEIASYLSDSPKDHVRFCNMTSSFLAAQLEPFGNLLWSALYKRKWPAFHDSMGYQGAKDWKRIYHDTFTGARDCILEVFDREKKPGFAMAAMAAQIQYDRTLDAYVAKYISASEVLPEVIPMYENHRLRFCPAPVRPRLQPVYPESAAKDRAPAPVYPFKVLEGIEGLVVGQGVELQWKMQLKSPFGWWFGHLEALHKESDGKLYTATITFKHFPSTSRWYRLQVRFGDAQMRPCAFGGYTGGVRAVTEKEKACWMSYLPKKPVDL
jgi:hypothetical protein